MARRLLVAAVLTVPVTLLAMVGPLQFDYWQWVSLVLAAPVVFWSGLPFHRSALNEVRHRMPGMDTLVSLGTLAAFAWSVVDWLPGEDAVNADLDMARAAQDLAAFVAGDQLTGIVAR